jgi:hypothetical protein
VAVTGDALGAIAALGVHSPRLAQLDPRDALATMAWCAASAGAHGRRRGMANGRFAAWWALAALGHLLDRWPVSPDEMGELSGRLSWLAWSAGEPETGWALHLAVEDRPEHRAWAVTAADTAVV